MAVTRIIYLRSYCSGNVLLKMAKWLPTRSALAHMRWVFSLFLLPVFLFALGQAHVVNRIDALLVFISWHLLAYPASNGYNSYFDRDEGSIALLKHPPKTDITLYYFSLFLEVSAIFLALFVSVFFALAVFIYSLLSKAYSHPAIRLKKYPWMSFAVIFIFQGGFIFWTTLMALDAEQAYMANFSTTVMGGLCCSFLIGASYPLTQIYQHDEDRARGDNTLSMILGIKNTFLFSAILYVLGAIAFALYSYETGKFWHVYLFLFCTTPAVVHFIWWLYKAAGDENFVQYRYVMRQTFVGAAGLLACFSLMLIV